MLSFSYGVNTHGRDKNWNNEALTANFEDRHEQTILDVVESVKAGYALCAGLLGGKRRSKSNVNGSWWALLDIDNTAPLIGPDGKPVKGADGQEIKLYKEELTLKQALEHPFVQKHCALIYTSASHGKIPSWDKLRLVFLFPQFIEGSELVEELVKLLMEHLPHDPSCKDASRVFYGNTQAEFPLINPDVCLPNEWIAEAQQRLTERKEQEVQRQKEFEQRRIRARQHLKRDRERSPLSTWGDTVSEILETEVFPAIQHNPSLLFGDLDGWKGAGKNAWCPLCTIKEKAPSFNVATDKPVWICYGCSPDGGNYLTYAYDRFGYRFKEAAEYLADLAGVKLPEAIPDDAKSAFDEPDRAEYHAYCQQEVEQEQVEEAQEQHDLLSSIKHRLKWLGERSRKKPIQSAASLKRQIGEQEDHIYQYQPGGRLSTWQAAIEQGYQFVLDVSEGGSGKSHDTGTATPDQFGVGQLFYVTDQQRNPTTSSLAEWAGLEGRHSGLTVDASGKKRVAKAGDKASIPGNCSRTSSITVLRSKNIEGADTDAACVTCPMLEACRHFSGDGYGFKFQRRNALSQPRRRSHPDSMPTPGDFDYGDCGIYWDEPGQTLSTSKIITVRERDIDQAIAKLATDDLEIYAQVRDYLSGLKKLMAGGQPRYGLSLPDIKKELPEVPEDFDWLGLREALAPDLSALQPPDGIDSAELDESMRAELAELKAEIKRRRAELKRLEDLEAVNLLTKSGFTDKKEIRSDFKAKSRALTIEFKSREKEIKGRYREQVKELDRAIRHLTAQSATETKDILEEKVIKQWLPEFLGILAGDRGYAHINHSTLTLTLPNTRHTEVIRQSRFTVFLDGTLSREDLALKIGCHPAEIFVCKQIQPKVQNLSIIQVTDMGRMGMQRGNEQKRRAAAIVSHFQQEDVLTRVIDFKKFADEHTGAWWRDSRGVNDFTNTKTLILVGTPCQNLNSMLAEYAVLTDCVDIEDDNFKAFVDRTIRADIHQGIWRVRANRRPDEQIKVIVLTDFDLQIPNVKQVKASDITIEAADKFEKFTIAVRKAAEQIKATGEKLTQTAIAAITGYSQGYISRFWKLLLLLLESPYSKSNNPDPDDLGEIADQAIKHCSDTQEVLETVGTVFFEWVSPSKWRQIIGCLSREAQIKVVSSLLQTLPVTDLEAIQMEAA